MLVRSDAARIHSNCLIYIFCFYLISSFSIRSIFSNSRFYDSKQKRFVLARLLALKTIRTMLTHSAWVRACVASKWIAETSKSERSTAVREWIVSTIHGDSAKMPHEYISVGISTLFQIYLTSFMRSRICVRMVATMVLHDNKMKPTEFSIFLRCVRPTLAGRRCCLTRLEWLLSVGVCVCVTGVHYAKFLCHSHEVIIINKMVLLTNKIFSNPFRFVDGNRPMPQAHTLTTMTTMTTRLIWLLMQNGLYEMQSFPRYSRCDTMATHMRTAHKKDYII